MKTTDDFPENSILIELKPSIIRGTQEVSISSENIIKQSEKAINNAMKSINALAEKVYSDMLSIEKLKRPDEATIEFGIKLTADANAYFVSAGTEGQFTVTLKWITKNKS